MLVNIIVVGLPGSYSDDMLTELQTQYPQHQLFAQFITKFHDGQLWETLSQGRPVIVADNRLSDPVTFIKYVSPWFKPETDRLILFENQPKHCLHNLNQHFRVMLGKEGVWLRSSLEQNLKYYHQRYQLAFYQSVRIPGLKDLVPTNYEIRSVNLD